MTLSVDQFCVPMSSQAVCSLGSRDGNKLYDPVVNCAASTVKFSIWGSHQYAEWYIKKPLWLSFISMNIAQVV